MFCAFAGCHLCGEPFHRLPPWPPAFLSYAPKYPCQIPHIPIHCTFPLLSTLFSQSGMAFAIIFGWSSESSSNGALSGNLNPQPKLIVLSSVLRSALLLPPIRTHLEKHLFSAYGVECWDRHKEQASISTL